MLALAIPLSVIGLGFFCWLLYSVAIYALPFFIGLSTVLCAHDGGAGMPGAIMLGLVTGGFVLATGQMAFALARSPILRVLLGLIFAVPAAFAGYYVTLGLAGLTLAPDAWRHTFALFGAIAVGTTAWLRLTQIPTDGNDHRLLVW